MPQASSFFCFFALSMSFLSLWIRKTWLLWGSFLVIAYVFAFNAHIATWFSLIPILTLFFCHYFLTKQLHKGIRFLLFGLAIIVSCGLAFHFFPGFHNWNLASDLILSPGAYPYSLWLNFDKPFIGLFALALSIPLISSKQELMKVLKICIPMSLVAIFLMMGFSLYFDLVQWNLKIPSIFLMWFFANLIFVTIPEEAFFRGFIQRWLYNWFGANPLAAIGSILVTSVFFSLLHLIWIANFGFFCLVFAASILFGVIYYVTKSIEASIICHFGLNLIHFIFFTYPALQK